VPPYPEAALLTIQGLVDVRLVADAIMRPLMQIRADPRFPAPKHKLPELAEAALVASGAVERASSPKVMLGALLSGRAALLFEDSTEGLLITVRGWQSRAVEEPPSEAVARGPREGFVETLQTNTALLRRRIRSDELTFRSLVLGRRTQTTIVVAYVRDLADPGLVSELLRRLGAIDIDGVLDAGQLREFITDAPLSPVATVGSTERPDVVAARLLEGRAAVLVDGSPFVLTVPSVLAEGFQSPQDYYLGPYFQSFMRIVRYVSFLFSVLALPLFTAIATYQQELLPTPLLLSLASSQEGTPFPVAIEAGLMLLFFELLREASLRMPRVFGEVVAIVGALVIGQAAVSAGLVSASIVIVTALTAISTFVVPTHVEIGAVARLILLALAATLGLFGVVMGILAMLGHTASVSSFGVPVLSPMAPLRVSDMKDVPVRLPWPVMRRRPASLKPRDEQRQASGPQARPGDRG
jgi:spore germination protein KA